MTAKKKNQEVSLAERLKQIVEDCRYRNGELIVKSCSPKLVELASDLHGINFEGIDFQQAFSIILDVLTKPKYRYRGKVPQDLAEGIVADITTRLSERNRNLIWYIALPCVPEIKLDINLGQGVDVITIDSVTIRQIEEANELTNLIAVQPELFDDQYSDEVLLHNERENIPQYDVLDNSGLMYLRVHAKGFAANQLLSTLDTDPVHIWKIVVAMLITSDVLFDLPAMKYLGETKHTRYLGKVSVYEPDTMLFAGTEDRPSNEVAIKSRQSAYLQSELTKTESRISRLYDSYLDGDISKEMYRSKNTEFKLYKENLLRKSDSLESASSEYYENALKIMELVKNAPLLFRKTNIPEEKRQIINILFQNLELDGDQLRWKYKKPFDSMASYTNDSSWLGLVDVFQELII